MINEAAPGEGVITIKSLEAFQKVADGQATKIIIRPISRALQALQPARASCCARNRRLAEKALK